MKLLFLRENKQLEATKSVPWPTLLLGAFFLLPFWPVFLAGLGSAESLEFQDKTHLACLHSERASRTLFKAAQGVWFLQCTKAASVCRNPAFWRAAEKHSWAVMLDTHFLGSLVGIVSGKCG